ncbi:hypothetical protein EJ08DRAFT_131694 [Tothia fuscella]|uniref:Uncharacterized protein n=1 Tax=Tothia fuscella TaxID=1048955 RepID=A0A9P4NVE8_9PEZI|nr:hypothetical protein EJ08DRAFT_131694 [Tothia fuscella]
MATTPTSTLWRGIFLRNNNNSRDNTNKNSNLHTKWGQFSSQQENLSSPINMNLGIPYISLSSQDSGSEPSSSTRGSSHVLTPPSSEAENVEGIGPFALSPLVDLQGDDSWDKLMEVDENVLDLSNTKVVESAQDLMIVTMSQTGELQGFLVSSKIIAGISEEWKKLVSTATPRSIFQPFGDLTLGNDIQEAKVATLFPATYNDTVAIGIFITVSHMRFHLIPPILTAEELHALAAVVEHYKCENLIRPFVYDWMQFVLPVAITSGDIKWLLTSCVLGCRDLFLAYLDYVIMESRKSHWELVMPNERTVSCHLPRDGSETILDFIRVKRTGKLESFRDLIGKFSFIQSCNTEISCVHGNDSSIDLCKLSTFGSLISEL